MARNLLCLGLMTLAFLASCSPEDDQKDSACDASKNRPVTGLSSCAEKKPGYFHVAQTVSYKGSLANLGATLEKAVLLGVEEINEAGGIDGKCLGFITCDDGSDAAIAKSAVEELVGVSDLPVIIGPTTSGQAKEVIPLAKDNSRILVSPSASAVELSNPAIYDDGGFFFRVVPSDKAQGGTAAYLAKRDQHSKVFVIHRDDPWGTGLKDVFSTGFSTKGTVGSHAYPTTSAVDAAAAITAAKGFGPDAIFMAAFVDDGVAVVKAAANETWAKTPKWILTDGEKSDDFITKVANNAFVEGMIGTSPSSPTGPDYELFRDAYYAAWNKEPDVYNANAYDALYLAAISMALSTDPNSAAAIKIALGTKTNSGDAVHPGEWSKVLELLPKGTMDYQGASGPVDFDASGDVEGNVSEWKIEGGAIVDVNCWQPDNTACPQ